MPNEPLILLVEDFPDDVKLLRDALQKANINNPVREVLDGEGAIAYLKGEEKYENRDIFPLPDLVLLDLDLPKLSGLEVLRWIHEQPRLRSLRAVVLIGSENLSQLSTARTLGAAAFLAKPLDLRETVRLLATLAAGWQPAEAIPATPCLRTSDPIELARQGI